MVFERVQADLVRVAEETGVVRQLRVNVGGVRLCEVVRLLIVSGCQSRFDEFHTK
jgi:hypothetical protein